MTRPESCWIWKLFCSLSSILRFGRLQKKKEKKISQVFRERKRRELPWGAPPPPPELSRKLIPSPNLPAGLQRPFQKRPYSIISCPFFFRIPGRHRHWWEECGGEGGRVERVINLLWCGLDVILLQKSCFTPLSHQPSHPPITFQLITASRASPQDTAASWLARHKQTLTLQHSAGSFLFAHLLACELKWEKKCSPSFTSLSC